MTGSRTLLWCRLALVPPIAALAVLGAIGSFATVRAAAVPYFGADLAWIVPVGLDLGILVLICWDLLLELDDTPWPVLRWIAWSYIGGTVLVNTSAAHGDPAATAAHAAMPVLFITVTEGVRFQVRRRAGLASSSGRERIPRARWLLAPVSTTLLWRRMVLWQVASYTRALELEQERLMLISQLQQKHGRFSWRWRASVAERLMLKTPPAEDTPEEDEELVLAACLILASHEADGRRISNTGLARKLRDDGHSVANERLAGVVRAARARMNGALP
ncbi:uncharacterized protein DUF2637 [Actinocorallia herbida]|uniref:Uncharacterized protein DUF2637 n=1 Tax=Actinocorallia herbida TaxID=58109 RepID=A0A3N1D3I5_9ACTN|nr:DUF2637 domain-containing protein [Actinocorallia herbida]ROO88082.1 uncharacterized protein DUF2637 [Actinocorallia herbida]